MNKQIHSKTKNFTRGAFYFRFWNEFAYYFFYGESLIPIVGTESLTVKTT